MNPHPSAPRTAEERLSERLASNMCGYLMHPIEGPTWKQAKVEALDILRQYRAPTLPAVEAAAREIHMNLTSAWPGISKEQLVKEEGNVTAIITKHLSPGFQGGVQCAVELQSDLTVCASQGRDGHEAMVMTTQEVVRGTLAELERLRVICKEQEVTASLLVRENQSLRSKSLNL